MEAPPSLPARILARLAGPPAVMRADAAAPREDADLSGAGISNALSGLGGSRDSGAMARPNLNREHLSQEELIALLRSSVYRRIVSLKPQWATARGWTITDSTDEEKPLAKALRRLRVSATFRAADTWARTLGESRVLLVTDDPLPLSEPLDPARVRKVHRLEVLDRREFSPAHHNADVSVGVLGEPDQYRLHPYRPGVTTRGEIVHASRLLRFYGDDLPPSEVGYNYTGPSPWGADAVGQTLWDGLRHLAQTGAGGARLAQELSIAVFTLGSTAGPAGDQRAALLSRIAVLNMMKSIANAVWLGPSDKFERVAANPSGFRDLSEHARLELALLTGYPLTLLFGIAPGGLNADGESWQAAWFADVAAYQEDRYRSPLESLIEVLYHCEKGGLPDEWSVAFNPLGDLTDKERAEIRLLHTQADGAAIMDGVLTPEEARGRYTQPGGFALELQPVEAPEEKKAAEVDPAAEAGARKLIEGELAKPTAVAEPGEIELTPTTIASIITVNEARAAKGFPPLEGPDGALTITEYQTKHATTTAAAAAAEAGEKAPMVGDRRDATEGACWIGLPLPESAHAAWAAARAACEAVTGPLDDPGDSPHVTALYLGQVAPEALAEIEAAVREVAATLGPCEVCAETVTAFPAGKDGTPIVMGVRQAWAIESAQAQLLARLAHLVTQKQFVPYRPHLTLGYAPTLGAEQQVAVMEAKVPPVQWTVARLEVRHGSDVVAVVPLTGRVDRAA